MTVDEAIKELLTISTDVRAVAILDADGSLLGAGPGAVSTSVGAAGGDLWEAAARRASAFGGSSLEHLVVDIGGASVAAVESGGRRILALTGPEPPVGLVLFDLRTCLADAFPSAGGETEGGSDTPAGEAQGASDAGGASVETDATDGANEAAGEEGEP